MNEPNNAVIEEGPHVTQLMRDILNVVVQKNTDILVLQPEGEHYVAIIQKGRGMELRRFKELEGPLVHSIIHCLAKAVDIRPASVPLVRQGKIKLKLNAKQWSIEVVSIPRFLTDDNGVSGNRPTVTLFFSECFEEKSV